MLPSEGLLHNHPKHPAANYICQDTLFYPTWHEHGFAYPPTRYGIWARRNYLEKWRDIYSRCRENSLEGKRRIWIEVWHNYVLFWGNEEISFLSSQPLKHTNNCYVSCMIGHLVHLLICSVRESEPVGFLGETNNDNKREGGGTDENITKE